MMFEGRVFLKECMWIYLFKSFSKNYLTIKVIYEGAFLGIFLWLYGCNRIVFCTNYLMILVYETLQVGEIINELTAWLG